jgi:DNA-binding CsgD family transcriptional regulator
MIARYLHIRRETVLHKQRDYGYDLYSPKHGDALYKRCSHTVKIPADIIMATINFYQRLILIYLFTYFEEGIHEIPTTQIAEELGMSVRYVKSHIKSLADNKLIVKTTVHTANAGGVVNNYNMTNDFSDQLVRAKIKYHLALRKKSK